MERNLVHGPGDYLGKPFRLRTWQKAIIYECYELDDDGSRRYREALVGLPKGNGKTELAAALGVAELAGPVLFDGWQDAKPTAKRRLSPDIPVAAASYDQADLVFTTAKTMISEGPLSHLFDCFDKEILPKNGHGRMYRVAAEAGTNDGGRPTLFIADELHEWLGRRARVHLVIGNALAKRADSWCLSITTAGFDRQSLLGRKYEYGQKVKKGEVKDSRFLFIWYEASPKHNLKTERGRRAAAKECNPAAGDFLSLDSILQRYHEIETHEWERYHGNRWSHAPDAFMEPEMWESAKEEREVADGATMALGFDGSYNRDCTALVGCTVDNPHLVKLGLWQRPKNDEKWKVDKDEVFQAILDAVAKYDVTRISVDDTFGRMWSFVFDVLEEKGLEVVEWPTRSPSRMSKACVPFKSAIRDGELTHDGDRDVAVHMGNGKLKEDRHGPRIAKDPDYANKYIDAAVASVIAYDGAMRVGEPEPEPDMWVMG